jgi:hypothetical protein
LIKPGAAATIKPGAAATQLPALGFAFKVCPQFTAGWS